MQLMILLVRSFNVKSRKRWEALGNDDRWLKNYLKYKFRDSYLYRYAEDKVNKPVHYLCLINFDNALNVALNKNLKRELPVGKVTARWNKKLCESCQVLNQAEWNKAFPKWPVIKSVDGAN